MASQPKMVVVLLVALMQLLTATSNVSASEADLAEEELIGELRKREQSSMSRSSLLPVEVTELIASNKLIRETLTRQSGTWPFYATSRCGLSYTRDTNYDKTQDLTDKINKLLNKYPRCGMTRLSLTGSYSNEPEEVFSKKQPTQRAHGRSRGKRSLSSGQSAASGKGTQEQPETKIVGGRMTRQGEWPWLAAIGLKANGPQCGGTLIADRWILTAAHCFDDLEAVCKYNVRLGARDWMNGDSGFAPKDVNIEAIYRHPDYDKDSVTNDIALLKLSSAVTMNDLSPINAVCLPKRSRSVPVGTVCLAGGWGLLETNSEKTVLNSRQVDLPVVTYDDPCGDWGRGTLQKGMLCAGVMRGGKDTCQGDSGGPLIYKSGTQWTQLGVTSFGADCAKAWYPGIYTDVGYHLPWVTSVISRYSNTLQ